MALSAGPNHCGSMASHRFKSVCFQLLEVSKENFDGTVLGASLYLGAVRPELVRAAAMLVSIAQLEKVRALQLT